MVTYAKHWQYEPWGKYHAPQSFESYKRINNGKRKNKFLKYPIMTLDDWALGRPPQVPTMPPGLVGLMEGLTKDVLKNNPTEVYAFCANHMKKLLEIRDGPPPQKVSLDKRIKIAQEKVRQRAKQRSQTYDQEIKYKRNVSNDSNITETIKVGYNENDSEEGVKNLSSAMPNEISNSQLNNQTVISDVSYLENGDKLIKTRLVIENEKSSDDASNNITLIQQEENAMSTINDSVEPPMYQKIVSNLSNEKKELNEFALDKENTDLPIADKKESADSNELDLNLKELSNDYDNLNSNKFKETDDLTLKETPKAKDTKENIFILSTDVETINNDDVTINDIISSTQSNPRNDLSSANDKTINNEDQREIMKLHNDTFKHEINIKEINVLTSNNTNDTNIKKDNVFNTSESVYKNDTIYLSNDKNDTINENTNITTALSYDKINLQNDLSEAITDSIKNEDQRAVMTQNRGSINPQINIEEIDFVNLSDVNDPNITKNTDLKLGENSKKSNTINLSGDRDNTINENAIINTALNSDQINLLNDSSSATDDDIKNEDQCVVMKINTDTLKPEINIEEIDVLRLNNDNEYNISQDNVLNKSKYLNENDTISFSSDINKTNEDTIINTTFSSNQINLINDISSASDNKLKNEDQREIKTNSRFINPEINVENTDESLNIANDYKVAEENTAKNSSESSDQNGTIDLPRSVDLKNNNKDIVNEANANHQIEIPEITIKHNNDNSGEYDSDVNFDNNVQSYIVSNIEQNNLDRGNEFQVLEKIQNTAPISSQNDDETLAESVISNLDKDLKEKPIDFNDSNMPLNDTIEKTNLCHEDIIIANVANSEHVANIENNDSEKIQHFDAIPTSLSNINNVKSSSKETVSDDGSKFVDTFQNDTDLNAGTRSSLEIEDNSKIILDGKMGSGNVDIRSNEDGDNKIEKYQAAEHVNDECGDQASDTTKMMDLETAAVTIQKVFRSFLFKSRASTFETSTNDDNLSNDENGDHKDAETYIPPTTNKDRRALGISRMDTVLQTVNEEKSLSLSTDDSSTLSSAATIIQAHVRGFLVRNKLNSGKTTSSNTSLINSNGLSSSSLEDVQMNKNKTILNIHIVPDGNNFLSRDESMITSMELSLDGSPPSSINLHPLSYDISEKRKQLKREDAIQSISPPSNNSGKLSDDIESVKELTLTTDPHIEKNAEKDIKTSESAKEDIEVSMETTSTNSLTAETVVDDRIEVLSSPEMSIAVDKKKSLIKQSSDEMDVVTPIKSSTKDAQIYPILLHSGEFHDAVLPTRVSRSDTPVVRGE